MPRPTARAAVALALVLAASAPVIVLWGMSWRGAEDAVTAALSEQLLAEGALIGAALRDVPVDLLASLGSGHATSAVSEELSSLAAAAAIHDLALIGPESLVLGSDGRWLPLLADKLLIDEAAAGRATCGSLYRGIDDQLYLTAYTPLEGHPGWVVAIEGSATLGAVDRLARRQALASVLLLLAVAALGLLFSALLSRPLRRLEATLLTVRPGDPPDRVAPEGPREVYRVACAVQTLLSAIEERDQRVALAHRREVEQLTRLAATIAHEVRNPLNAMSLSAARIARIDDPAQRTSIASRLGGQIEELDAIVARLLDLTRPLKLSPERVDLPALARRVASESPLSVTVSGSGVSDTDPTLLGEILRNLLLNSEQAGARHASIELTQAEGRLRMKIADDGPGIPDPASIFEWFHTSRAQGSGLGLPHSRRMAEALGGSLELLSATPAVFAVTLPDRSAL